MIELTFGESAGGTLKQARLNKQGEGLFGADVEALTMALDIGDISNIDTDITSRKKILDNLFEDFLGVSDEIWKTNEHALNRIQEARLTQEHIRMWISTSDPAEMCGLYFVSKFMIDAKTPLSVVYVPNQIEKDNCIICYRSTGEIEPDEFVAFTKYEKSISELQRRIYACTWSDLMCDNSPLRAIVNGIVVGVPNDFYDFALRANMSDGKFTIAQLIGKTLNQIPGVGDRWLFLRVQTMIQSGELIEISAPTENKPYSGVVKRG